MLAYGSQKEAKKTTGVMSESPITIRTSRRFEECVPMTRLRARIAERLVMAQQQAAIFTTKRNSWSLNFIKKGFLLLVARAPMKLALEVLSHLAKRPARPLTMTYFTASACDLRRTLSS